ncbi:hypothetical protein CI1B_06140 [Bradyrhizobium ivorense]|uniref:Cysteine rich repeat protein n=1 Tax=Bradyrhizobium ivorense TaxID=2511166 RepID=A0A508SUU9_9BRAD|nr:MULTISPECIES: hypothetical protein [Bradyrhizobium]MCC8940421.1 hypothetical protein [Bradyrhizobium ivorense]QOZ22445.1 hypothetical protein XH93_01350 [Bradyrhizobium sp. CCBAU 51753]VIO65511.1 hypothetical protein CI1B_06140 [Bradyrhizobium ivorense]VIO66860.1 hypothetical protein CI41S_02170 [Bradyrhizobium ivorense]
MTRFLLAVIPLVLLTSAASAQQQQGREACTRDAQRHCRPVLNNGDDAVLACLQQHRARLSKGCQKTLTEHGQ